MGDVPEYSATPAADELFPLLHCGVRCTLVRIVGMHPCTSSCTVMICTLVHIVETGDAPLHCVAMLSSAQPFISIVQLDSDAMCGNAMRSKMQSSAQGEDAPQNI